jgi:hypothetical protein
MTGDRAEVHEKFYEKNLWQTPRPIRPSEAMLAVYERWIRRVAEGRRARMLILGSTPELRDLALALGVLPVACDHSRQIWDSMARLMQHRGDEEFLHCNWLEIPEERPYDIVAGDGSLVMLQPDQIQPMIRKIAALLKPEGAAVLKVGARATSFSPGRFAEALAEYRRAQPPLPIYYYFMFFVTELRSERYLHLNLREVWEQVLFRYLTPEEIAEISPRLTEARMYVPGKPEFEAILARYCTIAEIVDCNHEPGHWSTYMYVLRARR